ncbi:MAG: hypothetical protein ACI8W7_000314 [Gammaproteobacteria bacterium]|jgi:uncharacterized protein YgiB involved in biofilm formation
MKRSKHIHIDFMRKVSGQSFVLRPLVTAIAAVTLSACGSQEEVAVVSSVAECSANTKLSRADCESAYKKAQAEAARTGPKYASSRNCEAEFGRGQCRQQSGGVFMPLMAGFMVGQLLSNSYNPVYRYNNMLSPNYNRIMTADGGIVGKAGQRSYRVDSDSVKPKPRTTRTISRGGFGAIASAKSNWGGGRSSRGWGG